MATIYMYANTIVNVKDSTLNEVHGNYVQVSYLFYYQLSLKLSMNQTQITYGR